MLNFFKKHTATVGIVDKDLVTALLKYILQDSTLSHPVYLPDVMTEEDVENIGITPLVLVGTKILIEAHFLFPSTNARLSIC